MLASWWLAAVIALPVSVLVLSQSKLSAPALWRYAVGAAAGLLISCLLPLLWAPLRTLGANPLVASLGATRGGTFTIDAVSLGLLPLPAALWLLTVAVTPRSQLNSNGLARTAIATLATTIAFISSSPYWISAMWLVTVALFAASLGSEPHRRVRRVALGYLGVSSALLLVGVFLLSPGAGQRGTRVELGLLCITLAALIRKGVFPFHAWIPELFERGTLGPVILFSAPQLGAYVLLRLVLPLASASTLRAIAILALITAVYGALLALFQRDARRACGYLFVSQSALIVAGLEGASKQAFAGALVLWISSGVAFAGLARCVLVLEARRGRLDLARHHGGYQEMPLLAVSFLVFGLACTGFPGTLGFAGEELLLDGAVTQFPVLGFLVAVTGALTGLGVLRMYFSLFCGRADGTVPLPLLPRESLVFGSAAAFLLLFGLAPSGIVASQVAASAEVLGQRQALQRELGHPLAAPQTRFPSAESSGRSHGIRASTQAAAASRSKKGTPVSSAETSHRRRATA